MGSFGWMMGEAMSILLGTGSGGRSCFVLSVGLPVFRIFAGLHGSECIGLRVIETKTYASNCLHLRNISHYAILEIDTQ